MIVLWCCRLLGVAVRSLEQCGGCTADFADADITQSSLSTHNMKWSSDQERTQRTKDRKVYMRKIGDCITWEGAGCLQCGIYARGRNPHSELQHWRAVDKHLENILHLTLIMQCLKYVGCALNITCESQASLVIILGNIHNLVILTAEQVFWPFHPSWCIRNWDVHTFST